MLKSLCIKTNNNRAINYLLDEFSNAKLNNFFPFFFIFSKMAMIAVSASVMGAAPSMETPNPQKDVDIIDFS